MSGRFLFNRKLRFLLNKKAPLWIALRRNGRCRLRDPPQAENPAKQDSFLFNRKLRFLLNKNAPLWMRTRAERKFVAKATALGARVPQAELFVPRIIFFAACVYIPQVSYLLFLCGL